MKTICVWGTSFEKVADEAQLLAINEILKARFPGATVWMFAKHGEYIAQDYPEIRTIRVAEVLRVFGLLSRCDLFVIVGGPFYEMKLQALTCLTLFVVAKLFRRPIAAYGITLFPLRTWWGKLMYRTILNHVDAIMVRDAIGVDILKNFGVTKAITSGVDPRYLVEPVSSDRVNDILSKESLDLSRPIIGVTTRYLHAKVPAWVKRSHDYSDTSVDNANEAMAKALATLSETAQLIMIPMHPSYHEDEETADKIRQYMKEPERLKVLRKRYTAPEIIGIIQHCELLLAGRQGSAIFAAATATPIVAVAYEARMIDHMQRSGLGDCVFDWKTLNYDVLAAKIAEVRATARDRKATRETQAEEWKRLAWKDTAAFEKFSGGE